MLVGIGLLLVWFWKKSSKTINIVPFVRKSFTQDLEKNTTVMESSSLEFAILFGAGTSELEKQSLDRLRKNLDPSLLSQIGYITLIGSADASGHLTTNRRLVKERISVVERYLFSLGIPKEKIRKIFLDPSFGRSPEERRLLRSVRIQYKIETLK